MKKLLITAIAAAVLLTAACVNTKPVLHPEVTPGPTPDVIIMTLAPTQDEGDSSPTPEITARPTESVDALGNSITGPEHFYRYLTFRNILVYEEDGDTFLDAMVENAYSEPISCAIDAVYYDENGEEIARARLQTRDGSYLLVLQPGETVVFAQILTDMTITNDAYVFEFDKELGVKPIDSDD